MLLQQMEKFGGTMADTQELKAIAVNFQGLPEWTNVIAPISGTYSVAFDTSGNAYILDHDLNATLIGTALDSQTDAIVYAIALG